VDEINNDDKVAIKALLAMNAGGLFQNIVRSDVNKLIPEGYSLETKLDEMVFSL
jgi:hypothetical protein